MPDNTVLPGTGETYAADLISDGGVANAAKVQRIKLGFGDPNKYNEVTVVNPYPVTTNSKVSSFGELLVGALTPVIQLQFPYAINTRLLGVLKVNSGAVTAADSLVIVSTGTALGSDALMSSVADAKYHPGLGILARWTSIFQGSGVTGTEAISGIGNEEDGFFFGYDGTSFGSLHRFAGKLEHQTLTITTGAVTASGTITITLDGTATEVEVVSSDSPQAVVRAIAAVDFPEWSVRAAGNEAIFISHHAENKVGAFTFADTDTTGTAASFSEIITGVAPTNTWTAQASWNNDVMDGTGPSGMTLDVSKGNVFQVQFQWLGFGAICFFVEDDTTGKLSLVHTIQYSNSNTTPSLQNPTLPVYISTKNNATTSDIVVKSSSMAVFTEGMVVPLGLSNSEFAQASGALTTETPLLSILSKTTYQGVSNRVDFKPQLVTFSAAGAGGAKFTTFRIRLNPILGGDPVFTDIDAANSIMAVDKSASSITGGVLVAKFSLGKQVNDFQFDLSDIIEDQPNGTLLVVTVEVDGGTTDASAGLTWRELF